MSAVPASNSLVNDESLYALLINMPAPLPNMEILEAKLAEKLESIKKSMVCDFNSGEDLTRLTNGKIAELIRQRLPLGTFESIDVQRMNHTFSDDKATYIIRKITLIRRTGIPLLLWPVAFFSSLFKADSVYRREINQQGIKEHLLKSRSLVTYTDEEQKNLLQDLVAVYTQYKTITLYVPETLKHEADIEVASASEIIKFSISSGEILRSCLFV